MNKEKLKQIIQEHKNWLDNKGGKRADLRDADLRDANLSDADLRHADLKHADLRRAFLRGAFLRDADLKHADLRRAFLRRAFLRGANLSDANLSDADLSDADLRDADLSDADLKHADLKRAFLRGAFLRGANLSDADLSDADLRHADLSDANLRGADFSDYSILPEEGSFIAWKKCSQHVVKLQIPENARRTSSLIGRKCRAEFVDVIEIYNAKGNPCDDTVAYGKYDNSFAYKKGERVHPDTFDDSIYVECSHGIHFFITKKEALEW